jgi:hypothetical protein
VSGRASSRPPGQARDDGEQIMWINRLGEMYLKPRFGCAKAVFVMSEGR